MDCGPTCLRMIAKYYGKHYNAEHIRNLSGFGKEGVSLLGISIAAEKIGLRTRGLRLTYEQLTKNALLPCILHWGSKHFVVILPGTIRKNRRNVKIADPSKGIFTISKDAFLKKWANSLTADNLPAGIVLLIEPTPKFFESQGETKKGNAIFPILRYFRNNHWQIIQVIMALLITSFLQLIFPFLTQGIVDTGIASQNLGYITIILIAQLMLIFSRTLVDFIRSRLLLRISTIVNISILSDFWIKLTRLPINYFDAHHTGDTLQRLNDNRQLQNFLTGNAISTLFSLFNFVIFAIVLAIYNIQLFFVFATGTLIYFCWVSLFLRYRRRMNYLTFSISAKENDATLQMIQGMQEIRLLNAENLKRWEWENLQAGIFRLNLKNLTYSQAQQAGAVFINQGKDIVITFLGASLVLKGQLTLGALLAIQYITGQLSSPIEQFVTFLQGAQDAKISVERLNEIHNLQDEEDAETSYKQYLPQDRGIFLNEVSFSYPGPQNALILDSISVEIPHGKVTAIVGVSGSGKTSLLKLLLKFYNSYTGEIKIGNTNFQHISPSLWRQGCGAVLQDGYIFNDSIAKNIAPADESPEYERLIQCSRTANILPFIESLPNGFNTQLGSRGIGISQGQRQRLLIARAIYKDPDYIFLDEATNALDTENERSIVENLEHFIAGKTVVIVAHRLSTVKNADQILVLHEGKIVERGTHTALSAKKGRYYQLVKNQLELGN